jgi:hypothetical protein
MAIELARNCQFPLDLDAASLALDQEIGDRLIANRALLDLAQDTDEINAANALVDQATDILEQIIKQGDGTSSLRTTADVAEQFGLPKDPPSRLDDDILAPNTGIILIDTIVYVPGARSPSPADASNIEVLRKLYIEQCSFYPGGNSRIPTHRHSDYR